MPRRYRIVSIHTLIYSPILQGNVFLSPDLREESRNLGAIYWTALYGIAFYKREIERADVDLMISD